jgi:type I restriction enzyme R subunit
MPNFISEDQIERALVQKLQHLHGFASLNCYTEDPEDLRDGSGRANKRDVILMDRVKEAAIHLNPDIPAKALDDALEQLLDRRQAMSLIAANREIYHLLRDGIPVEFDNAKGQRQEERVYLLNFNEPDKNRYLAVAQLWIKGDRGFRRPDLLLYINGIPLVFIELKNSNVKLKAAFDDNLTNYKKDIPQLFLTNAFCVLSNAIETKVGSLTAEWEHFFNWLRAEDEKEKIDRDEIQRTGTSLEGVIAGLFPRQRLLDYVENFVLYYKDNQKIIAQNHQFIGVNRAYETFLQREELQGKLGVFWHTQGSGKSFSMIFYARKIFRKQTGNFTS